MSHVASTAGRSRVSRNSSVVLSGAVPLAILSVAVTYGVEKFYDSLGFFAQWNMLFDADANAALMNFAHGWIGSSPRHPWIGFVFSVPLRVASAVASLGFAIDEATLRREIALLIVPLFQGVRTCVLFLLLRRLGLSVVATVLACLIEIFCLSRITIGSVPESFAISGTMLALFVYWSTDEGPASNGWNRLKWVLAGAFAIGITISNVLPMLIFNVTQLLRVVHLRRALMMAAQNAAAAALVVVLGTAASVVAYTQELARLFPRRQPVVKLEPRPPVVQALPAAFAYTLAAPEAPGVVPNILANETDRYDFRFSYADASVSASALNVLWSVFLVSILGLGSWRWLNFGDSGRRMAAACLLLLALYGVMHSQFFGSDMFLYTQHWEIVLLILCVGLCAIHQSKMRMFSTAVLLLVLIGAVSSSALTLREFHRVVRASETTAKHTVSSLVWSAESGS